MCMTSRDCHVFPVLGVESYILVELDLQYVLDQQLAGS